MRNTSRQTITGTVISDKMDKTVIVQTETRKQHPRYKKFITRRKRHKAHDENNECRLGDMVVCMECRPMSKDKRWRIVEILRRKYVSTEEIVETDELIMKKEKPKQQPDEEALEADTQETEADVETEAEVEEEAAAEEETVEAEETEEAGEAETEDIKEVIEEETEEEIKGDEEIEEASSETELEAQEEEQQEAETGETDDTGGIKA